MMHANWNCKLSRGIIVTQRNDRESATTEHKGFDRITTLGLARPSAFVLAGRSLLAQHRAVPDAVTGDRNHNFVVNTAL